MNYLLTASLLLLAIWPAYALLLHFSKRYIVNRFLLLLGIVAVFALPNVEFSSPAPMVSESVQSSISYVEQSVNGDANFALSRVPLDGKNGEATPIARTSVPSENLPVISEPTNYWWWGYLFGIFLLGSVLCFRLFGILALHLRSRPNTGYRELAEGAATGQAFTFGANVYVSPDLISNADFHHVMEHERVHAQQLHSLDILLCEIFLCVFWFHPAAWWIRAKMRANLEYLVDRHVVDRGADKRAYQLALVRQSQEVSHLALALPFSEPTLRNRISRLTGVPEYRVVAVMAALAFLFWLGLAGVVISGSEESAPATDQYLAASATDDAWAVHYDYHLSEELTSFELYTDRMLTGEEYLRVRAILAKAPGVKLFVYKNEFDAGPSLELRYANEEAARVQLNPDPKNGNIYMIGIETRSTARSAPNHFSPVSMELWPEHRPPNGGKGMLVYTTASQPNGTDNIVDLTKDDFVNGPIVYFNRQRVDLSRDPLTEGGNPPGEYTVNGVSVSELGRDEWTQVRVESRPQESPRKRLARTAGLIDPATGQPETQLRKFVTHGVTYNSYRADSGTFREWFEKIDISENRDCVCRYNDRAVSREFLLDTKFGDHALMQIAYDDGSADAITLMVLDDYPEGSPHLQNGYVNTPPASGLDGETHTLNIYLKRLPTPYEVNQMRPLLAEFPGNELRLFQSCSDYPGNLTFHVGKPNQHGSGYGDWGPGEQTDGYKLIKLTRYGQAGQHIEVAGEVIPPLSAPNRNFLLEVDGEWSMAFDGETVPTYNEAELDPPNDVEAFRCLMFGNQTRREREPEWISTYFDGGPEKMDHVIATLEKHNYQDRPTTFYWNNRPVSFAEFAESEGGSEAYVLIGGLPSRPGSPIYVQLVDPSHR